MAFSTGFSNFMWLTTVQDLTILSREDFSRYYTAGKVTIPLAITAFITVLGSSVPHGFNTGVLNIQQNYIKQFINESWIPEGEKPSENAISMVWSAINAAYLAAGCVGAFSAGWLGTKLGRKRALLVLNIFGFLGAALFGTCRIANSYLMLIFARVSVGLMCGAGAALVPMYLTEISPINKRGAMGVLHQLGLTCGILISQILGLREILGTEKLWPILLALTGVPCVLSLIVLPFFPDSPRYILLNKNDREGAEKALQCFRGKDHDVTQDIQEMQFERSQQEAEPTWTFTHLFKAKDLRMQLFLVCSLCLAQQLSGINVVFYYSTSVFLAAKIPEEYTQYATLSTGIINVIMTIISVPLMEYSGRRPLLLSGMVLMLFSSCIIIICIALSHLAQWLSYLSIVFMITFVIGFAIGLGSIPQFIGGELFKQGPRPPAMSIAGFLNWLANFLVGLLYPIMQTSMYHYSFLVFIGLTLSFLIYFWKYFPETKNKCYEELYKEFTSIKKSDDEGLLMTQEQSIGKRLAYYDDGLTLEEFKNEHYALTPLESGEQRGETRRMSTRRGSSYRVIMPPRFSIDEDWEAPHRFDPSVVDSRISESMELMGAADPFGRRATVF